MIEINNLTKSFGEIQVIKNVSIKIQKGEIYGIIGHSGAGKSTLLRCINGLEAYEDGSLTVMGREVKSLKGLELREFRKDLGMIFQSFNLLNRKTVFENIALPLEVWGYEKARIKSRVNELLNLVGLSEKANVKPSSLSGGQKQRVAIARAMANKPPIILADEPTGNLDTASSVEIMDIFTQLHKEGNSVILVTHEPDIAEFANRVIVFRDGIIVEDRKKEGV